MRNPYTVFESTRSFFTNTIQPLKLQDITPAELEQNILSIYAKLIISTRRTRQAFRRVI